MVRKKGAFVVGKREEEIIKAIYFYRYMTALDVTHLLYAPSVVAHVRKILTELSGEEDYVENQFLYRFPLQGAQAGNRVRVYTLGARGREYLKEELDLPVSWYFRPSKVRHMSAGHLLHNLVLTRFLVAARRWAAGRSDFRLSEVRTCYELGALSPKVTLKKGEKEEPVVVIPDAWALFEREEGRQRHTYPLLLEIDRGTEYRKKFTEHIASRIAFIRKDGPYGHIFGRREVQVVYVTAGETENLREARLRAMCVWAWEELQALQRESWASVFRFGSVTFKEMYEGAAVCGSGMVCAGARRTG
jgi:hypothetical protein